MPQINRPDRREARPTAAWGAAGWRAQPVEGLPCWRADALAPFAGLRHLFTGAGYNISLSGGVDPAGSQGRRDKLAALLGADAGQLRTGVQVHAVEIACVRGDVSEAGIRPGTDGFATAEPGVTLLAQTADCPLVLLYAPARHALALGHSGWRGTLAGMPARLVARLQAEFSAAPADMTAVVAPSAQACCYEIRDDVAGQLHAARRDAERFIRRADSRMYLDMAELIAVQLAESGLTPDRIHRPEQCSICDERFFSYRRQGPGGGHAALACCLR